MNKPLAIALVGLSSATMLSAIRLRYARTCTQHHLATVAKKKQQEAGWGR